MNSPSQRMIIRPIFKYLLVSTLLCGVINCHCNNQARNADQPPMSEGAGSIPPVGDGLTGGITNLGATCYMNSTLQILQACYEPAISKLNDTAEPLAAPLKKTIHAMKVEKRTVTSKEARAVFQALKKELGWPYNEGKQCDAAELLDLIFLWMKGPFLGFESTFIQQSPGKKPITMTSNVECIYMHRVPLRNDGQTYSIQQLFDNSLISEKLEDKNQKDDGTLINNVYKHTRLKLNESILPLQLMRFSTEGGKIIQLPDGSSTREVFEQVKIENRITNPMNLKIAQGKTTDNKSRSYTLVGFIWHCGSTDSGHYTAYVKQKETWVCHNDSSVTKITEAEAEARAQEAYLFFYQLN